MVECESTSVCDKTMATFSFNRYMVECESQAVGVLERGVNSFNRYMVECEYLNTLAICSPIWVLIDTWWNVNEWYVKYRANYSGFNRYMVECE